MMEMIENLRSFDGDHRKEPVMATPMVHHVKMNIDTFQVESCCKLFDEEHFLRKDNFDTIQ